MNAQTLYKQLRTAATISVLVRDKAEMAVLRTALHKIKTRENKELQASGLGELCELRSIFTSVDENEIGLMVTFTLRERTLKEFSLIEVTQPDHSGQSL